MMEDLTVKVTPKMTRDAQGNEKKANFGHLGTHFDVMDKEFPLENFRRMGRFFDVSKIGDREIEPEDISLEAVESGDFVIFYTGFLEKTGYGTERYFKEHPQLSNRLIDMLLERRPSMIGIDCAGVRRGAQHTKMDQYCADRGIFIIENLCNLQKVLKGRDMAGCVVNTYPVNFQGMTGLPCRVTAEEEEML